MAGEELLIAFMELPHYHLFLILTDWTKKASELLKLHADNLLFYGMLYVHKSGL